MTSWSNEQYQLNQMMNLPPMIPSMLPPPLMPPMCMMNDLTMPPINSAPPVSAPLLTNPVAAPLIGPVQPDNFDTEDMNIVEEQADEPQRIENQNKRRSRERWDSRGDRRDRDRDRDRSRRPRSRSRDRYERSSQNDRSDRNDRADRNDRNDRGRRERRSKWDSDKSVVLPGQVGLDGGITNIMMQGGVLPYANMNMIGTQSIDMGNLQNITNMSNMSTMNVSNMNMSNLNNLSNLSNIANILPGMNILPNVMNMVDPILINQQILPLVPNQPIFMNKCVLLPPIPGTTMPNRRERPPGCRTIFVGGLPNGIREDIIEQIFQRFGNINDIKLHRQGVCHVRFEKQENVEQCFMVSGYRFRTHDQTDNEATTIFVDYALNRDDQNEYEKNKRNRDQTPPRVEPYTPTALNAVTEKIKSDEHFVEAAPTLAVWLERGECNKKNANIFYSLIQASNNQIRRLFTEKMSLDDEYQNLKSSLRDKFANVVMQFEQVAKILTAAKHQRVSDHFSKQQRRNIEMWLKMTEEVENIKEEFNTNFDEDDIEKIGKNMVPAEKYEELKAENENLTYELEGYKNEAFLAKDEAERKFEKFKAHFIAQQALQHKQVYPPLPPPPMPVLSVDPPLPATNVIKPQPPPPTPDDGKVFTSGPPVPPTEAKLISILTAFLMVHPLGASLDYLVSYVRSMVPHVTHATVNQVLHKHADVFSRKTTGIGASIEHRWGFVTFDIIKNEA